MIRPALLSRLEERQPCLGFWITSLGASRFFQRTHHTSQGQIGLGGWPALDTRLNVVYMKGRFLRGLWQPTILADVASPLAYPIHQVCRDVAAHWEMCFV